MKRFLLLTTLFVLAVPGFGQLPAKIENTRIQDHALLLSEEQERTLQAKTNTIKASKDIELGVILVPSLNGMEPETYAYEIGKAYGIGSATGEHRGIVFLLAINDRKCFVKPSQHIDYVYTDSAMGQLCRDLRPQLKAQNYDGAVNKAVDTLVTMSERIDTQQVQGVMSNQESDAITKPAGRSVGSIILAVIGILATLGALIGGTIGLIVRRKNKREERRRAAESAALQERLRRETERREAWLKTPEGIAETKRIEEEHRKQEAVRVERARQAAAEEAERKRKYAIWAASPEGKAELKRRAKAEQEEAERRRHEEAERRRRDDEERESRRRREASESSFRYESSDRTSDVSPVASGGFGGSSDFGGGGGGSDW